MSSSQVDEFIGSNTVEEQPTNEAATQTPNTLASNMTEGQSVLNRKHMKARSAVWDHFEKIEDNNGIIYEATCNYCSKTYKYDSKKTGTSSLHNHIDTCIKNPNNAQPHQPLLNLQPSLLTSNQDGGSKVGTLSTWKYDYDDIRKSIAQMIIEDELPFNFVEKRGFRRVMNKSCPRFIIPSRWTITRDCFDLYASERSRLTSFFKEHCQRVSLTTDTWTSVQNMNYMCITVHFIDDNWILHKKILNFVPVYSHKGDYLGKMIETCLVEWGLRNVFTITVDNASSNDTCLTYLKKRFTNWDSSVAACRYLHMRCIAHIINLVVTDGLKDVDESVERVRNAVKFIRSSPSRLNKFKECVNYEGIESKSSLCLDVATRWNSTYLMLTSAEKFERAFEKYEMDESSYVSALGEKGVGHPMPSDWTRVRKIADLLKVFYDTTLRISGSLYVTANSFFHEISELCGVLNEWKTSDDLFVKGLGMTMMVKFEKYWGDPHKMNKLIFLANIFDPRYKFSFLGYSLHGMYGLEKGEDVLQSLRNELVVLFKEYNQKYNSESEANASGSLLSPVSASSTGHGGVLAGYKRLRKETGGGEMKKTELDTYLNEDVVEDDQLDVLMWWKLNSSRLPILAKMARDMFAVPISTVASESVFSAGGRVLDDFRSSLTPRLVESLICTQNWLQDLESEVSDAKLEELEKFEKDLPKV